MFVVLTFTCFAALEIFFSLCYSHEVLQLSLWLFSLSAALWDTVWLLRICGVVWSYFILLSLGVTNTSSCHFHFQFSLLHSWDLPKALGSISLTVPKMFPKEISFCHQLSWYITSTKLWLQGLQSFTFFIFSVWLPEFHFVKGMKLARLMLITLNQTQRKLPHISLSQ